MEQKPNYVQLYRILTKDNGQIILNIKGLIRFNANLQFCELGLLGQSFLSADGLENPNPFDF